MPLSMGWLLVILAVVAVVVAIVAWVVVPLVIARATAPLTDRLQARLLAALPVGSSLRALRGLGFYAADAHLSDVALVEKIELQLELRRLRHARSEVLDVVRSARGRATERDVLPWNWHVAARAPVSASREALDLLLLSSDHDRIWWWDRRCVLPNAGGYVTTLHEWASIARGALRVEDAREIWETTLDPVRVEARINGNPLRYQHLIGADPQLDTIGLRAAINPLIASTGYQIEVLAPGGDPNVAVVLTAAERRKLADERGWAFVAAVASEQPRVLP